MLVLTFKDGDRLYIGATPIRVFIEDVYLNGRIERAVVFEILEDGYTLLIAPG